MGAKELATGPVERGVLNQPGERFVIATAWPLADNVESAYLLR